MGQALYRKYRSKNLSEIVGQEHITQTLNSALKSGRISHAYLFTGPRGVGKTSIARILAHEVNQLPYKDESIHLDIIEIDAASNRRIDEIRDLRDKVHIAPTSAKYKVYIIDEVHMLTKEAFNALLKTLEEPPAHVIFILATTELHKLPDTIVSRTQRFTFKSVETSKAVDHLKTLAKKEGIDIEDDALELLALSGNGSFRDSISLLDQVRHSDKKITKRDAEQLIGIAGKDIIDEIIAATLSGTPAQIVESMDKLTQAGVNSSQAAKQIADEIRLTIIEGNRSAQLLDLLQSLVEVSGNNSTVHQLEVTLFRANLYNNTETVAIAAAEQATSTQKRAEITSKDKMTEVALNSGPETVIAIPEEKTEEVIVKPEPVSVAKEPGEWWQEVLQSIKSVNNTLYGVLRMAVPSLDENTLELRFNFDFHRKKAADVGTLEKIQNSIKEITGQEYIINPVHIPKQSESTVQTETNKPDPEKPKVNNEDLNNVTNIFGGGEVLES